MAALIAVAALSVAAPPAFAQGNETNQANVTDPVSNTENAADPVRDPTRAQPVADDDGTAKPEVSPDVYNKMFKILFAVFAIAVVLESALALVFNWRPFLKYFDGRGVKSLISLALGWAVAASLDLDVVQRLYAAMLGTADKTFPLGEFVTGLVLAGGSAGVHNIMRALGFRQTDRREEVIQRPEKTEAWLAVRLKRKDAKGPVQVFVARNGGEGRLVGTITGDKPPPRAFAWAFTDSTRFPTVAGFPVAKDDKVEVILKAGDKEAKWGPYTVGPGAIIDFELTL
jgi:hypothetical protein